MDSRLSGIQSQKNLRETLLNEQLSSTSSKDVVFVVLDGGKRLTCSRRGLAGISDYFKTLLYGNFVEKDYREISLHQVSIELFKTVLELSTDITHASPNVIRDLGHAWELLEVADMMCMNVAASKCDEYICNHITAKNLEEVITLGHTFGRSDIIQETIRNWAKSLYGKSIEDYASFHNKKCNDVYLDLNESNLKSKKDNNETKQTVEQFQFYPKDEHLALLNTYEQYDFIHSLYIVGGYNFNFKGTTECAKVNADLFLKQVTLEPDQTRKGLINEHISLLKCKKNAKEKHNQSNELYEVVKEFPDYSLEDYRIVSVRTCLYVIGGYYYDKQEPINTTWEYITGKNIWRKTANMKHKRLLHCVAVVDDVIYVCGGYDGIRVHSTMEAFHAKKRVWISQPDMPIGVGNAACTSCDKIVYVICGQFGVKSIETTRKVQLFNTKLRQWSVVSEYNSPVFHPFSEYGMSCEVLQDEIYMVGGQTLRVDCFNVKTKTWRRVSDMKCRRLDAATLVYRNRLLVAGGYEYNTGRYYDTIEVYDAKTNVWSMATSKLPHPAKNIGFCYIFDVERNNVLNKSS